VNVKRSMERILLLGDLDDTGSYVDHELSIDDTDLVKATAVGTDVVESCEKRLYAKLLGRLPSLANITQASIDEYSANTMLKRSSPNPHKRNHRYPEYYWKLPIHPVVYVAKLRIRIWVYCCC
jgi:hypothetical protein